MKILEGVVFLLLAVSAVILGLGILVGLFAPFSEPFAALATFLMGTGLVGCIIGGLFVLVLG